jgi:hypothetical protein
MQQLFRFGLHLGFGLLQHRLSRPLVWQPLLRSPGLSSGPSATRLSPSEQSSTLRATTSRYETEAKAAVTKRLRDHDTPKRSQRESCISMHDSRCDPNQESA